MNTQDLDNEPFLDVVKSVKYFQHEKKIISHDYRDKRLPGYVQEVQAYPAKFVLFSALQLNVIHHLARSGPVSLLFDGTGGLIRSLSEPYDTSRLLLYTLLAQTRKGMFSVPVMEIVSPDARHVDIVNWLYTFFTA